MMEALVVSFLELEIVIIAVTARARLALRLVQTSLSGGGISVDFHCYVSILDSCENLFRIAMCV